MNLPSPLPSFSDFEATNWQTCLSSATVRTCWNYHVLFGQQAEIYQLKSDDLNAGIFKRLEFWTALGLSDNNAAPFPESFLNAIPEQDFALLRELAPSANDAELRARLADLAWQGRVNNRRDPDMARSAINAYLQASENFPDRWREQTKRIERALQIALSLGHQAPEIDTVWQYIEDFLAKINGDDDWFTSARLMELMQERGRGDATIYAPMAERAALKAEAKRGVGQRNKARRYWEVKAHWHEPGSEEWLETKRLAAETYVAEAQDEIEALYGKQNFIAAAMHLQKAIEAYRNIVPQDGFVSRIQVLHQQMIEVNKQAESNFNSYSHTIDISAYVQESIQKVEGLPFESALREVVLMYRSPEISTLEKDVENGADEMIELLVSYEKVNASGQVVASRPSLFSSDPKQREEARTAEMFYVACRHRKIFVEAMLLPALYHMGREHRISTRDWVQVIHNSPFVPADREWLFARGFQAGWEGNWDVATHLLVPQVENSVRHILKRNGAIASTLRDGLQSEQGLDQTLKKPELTQLIPEDIIFDLRGLLVERMGDYLRHKTSHGLISFTEFYSVQSVYLWWLTLHLCLLPLISNTSNAAQSYEGNEDPPPVPPSPSPPENA